MIIDKAMNTHKSTSNFFGNVGKAAIALTLVGCRHGIYKSWERQIPNLCFRRTPNRVGKHSVQRFSRAEIFERHYRYFDRQLQEFADFAAGHHRKLARQYNAASEFRRCQHLYN